MQPSLFVMISDNQTFQRKPSERVEPSLPCGKGIEKETENTSTHSCVHTTHITFVDENDKELRGPFEYHSLGPCPVPVQPDYKRSPFFFNEETGFQHPIIKSSWFDDQGILKLEQVINDYSTKKIFICLIYNCYNEIENRTTDFLHFSQIICEKCKNI